MLEPSTAPVPGLTVPVNQLGRRPGTSLRLKVEFTAAEGIGTEAISIAAGKPVKLDLLLESVLEGVLATGTVRSEAFGECGRCLDEVSTPVEVTFQELFGFPERAEPGLEDPDQLQVVDDAIDLTAPVRDAVVLSLPFNPLCREDCPGLCSECGARLADEPEHRHRLVDPRWAALQDILEDEREEI